MREAIVQQGSVEQPDKQKAGQLMVRVLGTGLGRFRSLYPGATAHATIEIWWSIKNRRGKSPDASLEVKPGMAAGDFRELAENTFAYYCGGGGVQAFHIRVKLR